MSKVVMIRTEDELTVAEIGIATAMPERRPMISRRAEALLAAAGLDRPHRRWYVVTVAAGMDRSVCAHMAAAGIEAWIPEGVVRQVRRRRMPAATAPVSRFMACPGYLMVRVEQSLKAWACLAAIPGARGVLGADGVPLAVAAADVDAWRAALGKGCVEAPVVAFGAGEVVRVKDGPFLGFNAMVRDVDDSRGRVSVEAMLFGRRTVTELDLAQIEKV